MGVRRRKHRQESKGFSTNIAEAAADPNPIVVFIVSLLAAATMPDDRLAFTNRALPQDDLGASGGPIGSQVALVGGKWDKKNRGNRRLCPGTVTAKIPARRGAFASSTKFSTGKG